MVLIIKLRKTSDARAGMDYRQRDLAFVKRHVAEGWADTLVVTEVNEGDIIADIVRGKSSLDVLAGLLE